MRDRMITAVTSAVAVALLLWIAGLAGAGPLARASLPNAPDLPAAAPSVVSYQGRVTVNGAPFGGTGYFKFAIVDLTGTMTHWSNDGTSAGGGEPNAAVPLPVSNGLFNVLLGDTALPGMTEPLGSAAFGGNQSHLRFLRVWFSADDVTYEQLSPDRRLAAVPYALHSQEAVNADMVDGQNADDLDLPTGAMVLGRTKNETTLIAAGYSYAGRTLGDSWATKAAMPTGRSSLAAAVVDGIVYAIGGDSAATPYETANEAYDPVTNSWSSRMPMPNGRNDLTAAVVDGVVYAMGGWRTPGQFSDDNEAYDPTTNLWTTKAPLPTGRHGLAAAAVDGIVYAIGGWSVANPNEAINDAYDPTTDSWTSKAPMPTGRSGFGVAVADGVIYAVGGISAATGFETTNEAYDPETDSWTTKAPMPTGRQHLAAAAVDGVVYAVGGSAPGDFNEAYDPETDSWVALAPMPTGRSHLATVAVDNVLYAIGGGANSTANEAYTPALYVYEKQ